MDTRHLIWLGAIIGGFVGGYIPALWGASYLSMSGVIFSVIGGLAGIYLGHKLSSW